jgi:predicted lipoprotein with Yx(FWY)xxD motif
MMLTLLAPLAVAGCGGAGYGAAAGHGGASTAARPTAATTAATIAIGKTSLGSVLTDSQGRTLYYFTPDREGTITCTASCAANWPPFVSSAQPTSTGLPGEAGLVKRPDGASQVTYDDWALYTFAGDKKPGDVAGQGVGGKWFVATPGLRDPDQSAASPATVPPPNGAQGSPAVSRQAPAAHAQAPSFNDRDADNAGGPSDGDGNG